MLAPAHWLCRLQGRLGYWVLIDIHERDVSGGWWKRERRTISQLVTRSSRHGVRERAGRGVTLRTRCRSLAHQLHEQEKMKWKTKEGGRWKGGEMGSGSGTILLVASVGTTARWAWAMGSLPVVCGLCCLWCVQHGRRPYVLYLT